MAEQANKKEPAADFYTNALVGFLGVLLFVLVIALFTRFVYPRVEASRDSQGTVLIGDVIQVEVLNGCGVGGVASKVTQALRNTGFDVVDSGNFDSFDVEHSFIIDRTGNLENAKKAAMALGIDEKRVIQEISKQYFLDASIVIGSDFNQLKIQIK